MTVEPLSSYSAAMRSALGCLYALRKLQREAALVLREARHCLFQEKPVSWLPRSSSAWPYSSIMQPGCLASGLRWHSTGCAPMIRYSRR